MTREFQFYIVPTPIGNIKDITMRAIEVLKSVDLIACEDTRITQKILNHYDISTKCISYHKYNEYERVEKLIQELTNGKKIALVSDAGTPMICDPGTAIIRKLEELNISYTSLPGACAITTFLSQVPRDNEKFTFIGFMPRTQKEIEKVVSDNMNTNLVFYDSPERILKTLQIIQAFSGDLQVTLGRELSKLFEEIKTDKISEILKYYQNDIKGEIVCMLHAVKNYAENDYGLKIKELKKKNFKDKEIATILSTLYDVNKNEIYKQILNNK